MPSIEDLRRRFLVDPEAITKQRLEKYIEALLPHCVVDKKGGVHVADLGAPNIAKIKLALAARLLASELDSKISADLGAKEAAASLNVGSMQVAARMKELADKGFARRIKRGIYQFNPIKLDALMAELQIGARNASVSTRRDHRRAGRRKHTTRG